MLENYQRTWTDWTGERYQRTSFHLTKLNYTEDHLFLLIFFVQCIRFL